MIEVISRREDVGSDNLRAVYDHWNAHRGGRIAPKWKDIDMMTFPPKLIPFCLIVDVIDDGQDFVYRFWGTHFTEVHGYDYTGGKVSDLVLPGAAENLHLQYGEAVAARRPMIHKNQIIAERGFPVRYDALRLPLSSDGKEIDILLSAIEQQSDPRITGIEPGREYRFGPRE